MATKTPSSSNFSSLKKPKTTITVKHDCGFNNHLFIRGTGIKGLGANSTPAELSWNKGIPLKNISANEWIFECETPLKPAEFKVLINDEIYECGENHSINPGQQSLITPSF